MQKSLSTILYLFVAALAPAITFGSRLAQMASLECRCPFSGQLVPWHTLLWSTICLRPWISSSCRFTSGLMVFGLQRPVGLVFIIDGARPIVNNFADGVIPLTNCMLEALLFIYTSGLATYWSGMRRTPWMLRPLRNFLAQSPLFQLPPWQQSAPVIYLSTCCLWTPTSLRTWWWQLARRLRIVNPNGLDLFPMWGVEQPEEGPRLSLGLVCARCQQSWVCHFQWPQPSPASHM